MSFPPAPEDSWADLENILTDLKKNIDGGAGADNNAANAPETSASPTSSSSEFVYFQFIYDF